jgi:hypothetical protein
MAWGARPASQPIDDLVARLAADDPALPALALLPARRFGEADALALAAAMATNTNCIALHLDGRAVSPAGAAALAAALGKRPLGARLDTLALGDAAFGGGAGLVALAEGLAAAARERSPGSPPLVGTLDLEGTGVGPGGAAALAQAASATTTTTPRPFASLGLARNPGLGDAGAAALARALPRLTSLDVRACGLGPVGAAALVAFVPTPTHPSSTPCLLRCLRAGGGDALGAGGGSALGSIALVGHLEELHLTGAGEAAGEAPDGASPGDAAAHEVGRAFASPAPPPWHLHTLNLAGSGTTDVGVASLSAAMAVPGCTLRTLDLGGAAAAAEEDGAGGGGGRPPRPPITDIGASRLGDAMAEGPTCLAHLDLSRTAVTGVGAVKLLPPGGPSPASLCLAGAPLGDAGGRQLADALGAGGGAALVTLDLAACGLGGAGVGALAAVLERAPATAAPALRTLVLGGNPGATAGGGMGGVCARLRAVRPSLDVAWTVGDAGEARGGAGAG